MTDHSACIPTVSVVASASDHEDLRRLVSDYVATWYRPGHPFSAHDQQLLATLAQQHTPPSGASLLARADSAPVGCVLMRAHPDEPDAAELRKMYTVPSVRRRGVGYALLVEVARIAQRAGYRQLLLDVAKDRTAAVALYRSHGFVEASGVAAPPGFLTLARHVAGLTRTTAPRARVRAGAT